MVERFEDTYSFNLEGNFRRELDALNDRIEAGRAGFRNLAQEVQIAGGKFSASKKAFSDATKAMAELGVAGRDLAEVMPVQENLASSAKTLATAYNQLASEQNKLAAATQAEAIALDLAVKKADPRLIQMRAQAKALRALTRTLEDKAYREALSAKAEELGITLSDKLTGARKREATAEEKAAKAIERANQALEVRAILAKQGRDSSGFPQVQGPTGPNVSKGKLTAFGEMKAQQKADAELEKKLIQARTAEILKANGVFVESSKKAREANREITALTETGKQTESTFNRVSFTFRRLIGIMAVFTVARQVVSGFTNIIKTAIEFNAAIETSRVGLAGLIAAAANVRDPLGNALGLDDQVLQAQNIAIDQMNKLRREALLTAASYDELSRAFSSAIAPGLQAGLDVDQIRKITVNISQAATGLGLAQDQLAEEIRSLFSGTISARNTRIATALGISNEDIKRAKELGTLFDFLSNRFAAISRTGKLLMDTFTGQLSNASDAFKQLLATSSEPLFQQLKGALSDIQKAIFTTTEDAVLFKPETLRAFRSLFQGLANGVQGIRTAFASIDLKGFGASLGAIGNLLGSVAASLANALTIFFNVASPTFNILSGILGLFSKIAVVIKSATGFQNGFLGTIVLSVAKVSLLVGTYNKIAKVLSSIRKIAAGWLGFQVAIDAATGTTLITAGKIGKVFTTVVAVLKKVSLPLLAITASIAVIDGLLAAFGSDFRITTFLTDSFDALVSTIGDAIGGVKGLKEELSDPVKNPLGLVTNDFRQLKSDFAELAEDAKKTRATLENDLKITQLTLGTSGSPAAQISNRLKSNNEFKNSDQFTALNTEIQNSYKLQFDLEKQLAEEKKKNAFATNLQEAARNELISKQINATRKYKESLQSLNAEQLKSVTSAAQLPAGFIDIPAFGDPAIKKSLELLRQSKLLEIEIAGVKIDQTVTTAKQVELEGKVKAAKEQVSTLTKLESERQAEINKQINLTNSALAERENFDSSLKLKDLQITLAESTNAFKSLTSLNAAEIELAQKKVETQKIQVQGANRQKELLREIGQINDEIFSTQGQTTKEALAYIDDLKNQLQLKKDLKEMEDKISKAALEKAKAEERLAQLRLSGTGAQGINRGLALFASQNQSSFNIGEQFGQDLANGVTEFAGNAIKQSVAAAFDPAQNFDLAQAAGNLALDLGAGLATDLLKQGLANLLTSLGVQLIPASTALTLGASAITTSAGTLALSGKTVASLMGFVAQSMVVTINSAATTATTVIGTMLAALLKAQGRQVITSGLQAAGGKAKGGKASDGPFFRVDLSRTHANAQGFARGGRPRGIDPRDTIPAFLRPNEWVIRPEATSYYGDKLMAMINSMKISRSALAGIANAGKSVVDIPLPKRSFATGGPVRSSSSRSSSPAYVLDFHDEQKMERALAAGPDSVMRFSRRHRGGMRAALGFDTVG